MHKHRRSESHSPSRKRMRLSSPTFDDQVGELSQDDIYAFDCLDAQLSQSLADLAHTSYTTKSSRSLSVEDGDHPFRADKPLQTTDAPQKGRICAAFMSASSIDKSNSVQDEPSEPPNEAPPEIDYVAWFNTDSSNSFVGFSTAATAVSGFQRPSVNGTNAKSFIPSTAALREAEEKMRKWQEDVDQVPTHDMSGPTCSTQVASLPSHAAFFSARSAFPSMQIPETPTPAPLFRSGDADSTPTKSYSSVHSLSGKRQAKPFKSPLISTTSFTKPRQQISSLGTCSPLPGCYSTTASSAETPVISPLRPSSVVNHALTEKSLGFTPKHASLVTRPKFVTPFKPNTPRTSSVVNRIYPSSVPSPLQGRQITGGRTSKLNSPPGRQTLATSGLRPQAYSAEQLENMGINLKELGRVNLQTAPFYAFTTRSRSPPNASHPSSPLALGRTAVLEELHAKGCTLAKQAWVDNHWPLVLWKLAGMVALDPISESDPVSKRWCWPEVIRQFMYRYERDLNHSSRPPLRLITTRDASAESPLVLCISDIIFPSSGAEEAAAAVQTYAQLEVTDGWYRLLARIDAPLERAVRKGKIKIGRKIAVAGARLSAERKEGSEILEAYNSNMLLLTGNSTHMAPWHAKLGFQRRPFVATLNSLTADGGNVAVMMLTVAKVYPIAYIEFVEGGDGQKRRVGPHDEKEEMKLSTQWKTKRESHASRLWFEYEKRNDRLLKYAERLEQRAGSESRLTHEDGPPDKIYDLYDTLQEDDAEAAKDIMSIISREDAGWLAQHIRQRTVQETDRVSQEIERELESICPSRDVKAFCVIAVHDTRTYKYPSKRTAQVTVWNVPGVSVPEGCTKSPFTPGQRYLVTNLVPVQASAWMDRSSAGEVYLSTRKNSKWTLVD